MAKQLSQGKQPRISAAEIKNLRRRVMRIDKLIAARVAEYERIRTDYACFPLLMGDAMISPDVVSDVFTQLKSRFGGTNGKLDVIVDCGGGDVDAAYNLAELFRHYAVTELNFIVPRRAKNASTLLLCGANAIYMTPVAEIGPLDPDVIEYNPLERKLVKYSPIYVRATLRMINDEFAKGNDKFAQKLMERMEFPLSIGGFQSSIEISRRYIAKLLESRMIAGAGNSYEVAQTIAGKLTSSYIHPNVCINADEARSLGLNVQDVGGDTLDVVWDIYNLYRERNALELALKQAEVRERLAELPKEFVDLVFPVLDEAVQETLQAQAQAQTQ